MKNDNSLDKFVEKYPTYIEALDIIDDLKKQLERHNKYFNSFSCDSFDEFADFISTFMLTPHEEQTLIKDLKKQLEEKELEKPRELHAIKDDASQCIVINGVKFSYEQILIIQNMNYNYDMKIKNLKKQLKSQPAEIVEKIRNICCVEDKCEDGSFILGINEKDLDTILKEYQK